jgi:hypothetical protein
MKKAILFCITLLTCNAAFSTGPERMTQKIAGTYGVCSCGGTGSQVQLTINADNTFRYTDPSDQGKPVEVRGTWEMKRNYVILHVSGDRQLSHNKWKLDRKYPCIRSFDGTVFYRLCNVTEC